ncbi:MAG: DJ-1/PfpI family protein [Muribaculum sp.]|nr:DJ-1/PfpI family protein [Muribaculaceae bacterium]MCM1080289.1 DJ-1/PfpI family protein [Muribaculum sp.]
MAKSYIFLADGFEEIEALATADIMRRAQMDVATVAITDKKEVKGANGITVVADISINQITPDEAEQAEWLIAPGGMPGATNLAACGKLNDMLINQWRGGRKIASICASPAVVLAPLGILQGLEATCYPSFEQALQKGGATYVPERVVIAGNIITSNGPSSALAFGYAIVAATLGNDVASSIASAMLV